jgi:chaperonin GroEL
MIEGLLRHVVENNRALFIIGEITQEVLATFNLNVQKGNLKFAHIIPPSMGNQKELLMSDIAAMTYGTYYSEMAGNGIMNLDIDGLGTADKVIVGQSKTIIVPKKLNKEYIDELKAIKDKTAFDEERIDKISGKLNTIHIGASTSVEQNELYDQVEDVVLACKSALEQGVVAGGGVTYKDIAKEFTDGSISSQIIRHALLEPINTISDYEGAEDLADGIGYDAIVMDIVDMEKSGILDPAKVAREAFKNAMSVATILINTNTVVYESAK